MLTRNTGTFFLQASTFSNWGNLPTAVVQTIATQDPFDPKRDPTLGVAYVSVFMLIVSPSSVQIADPRGSFAENLFFFFFKTNASDG
jgi:hypothetical protein